MKKTKILYSIFFSSLLLSISFFKAGAQAVDSTLARINKFIDKQEQEIFKFGVSVGTRTGFESEKSSRAVAFVRPEDSTVFIDYADQMALIISTSVTAFPFKDGSVGRNLQWLGFTANINLAELADDNVKTVFNKKIDGGLGFAFALDVKKQFCLGVTYERTSLRRPTQYVLDKEGKQIIENGQAITKIDAKDDRYYIDSGINAWSGKFIYHF